MGRHKHYLVRNGQLHTLYNLQFIYYNQHIVWKPVYNFFLCSSNNLQRIISIDY